MSDENKSQPPRPEVPRPVVKPTTPEIRPPQPEVSQVQTITQMKISESGIWSPQEKTDDKTDDNLEIEEVKEPAEEPKKEPPLRDRDRDPAHPELFELRLTETGVQTGSIPITWCIDRKWADENYGKDYWVLLSAAPPRKSGKNAEWRGWAKLSDMMAFVTFYRPGKNRIMARVTPCRSDIEQWMERSEGEWKHQAINFPKDWEKEEDSKYLRDEMWTDGRLWNYIDVDLPEECFAGEPPEWEKAWVNFFFRKKAVDQCEYRRRRMLAYSLQPLAFIIITIIYMVAVTGIQLVNLFIGKWTIWDDLGSLNARVDERVDYLTVKRFDGLSWLFVPIPLVLLVGFLLLKIFHIKKWLMVMLALAPTYILTVLVSWGLILLLAVIFSKFLKMYADSEPGRRAARARAEEERRLREEARRREELEFILCSAARIRKIKDLPKSKRTVRLRFQGVKALVCKPFAR